MYGQVEWKRGTGVSQRNEGQLAPSSLARYYPGAYERKRGQPQQSFRSKGKRMQNSEKLVVLFDGSCHFCTVMAELLRMLDWRHLSWLLRISVLKKSAHESSTSSFSWQSINQRGGVKTVSFLIVERIS